MEEGRWKRGRWSRGRWMKEGGGGGGGNGVKGLVIVIDNFQIFNKKNYLLPCRTDWALVYCQENLAYILKHNLQLHVFSKILKK